MARQKEHKVEIRNRRASFDYEFLETYIAGISLVSTEIKSIRMGKASLVDSFCYFVGNELFVKGMNVAQYFWGSWGQHEPTRDRKLLLTKRELRHLRQAVKEKGLTIVATKLFINDNGLAKLVIALAKGKKIYDKRATIKEKDLRRELDRGNRLRLQPLSKRPCAEARRDCRKLHFLSKRLCAEAAKEKSFPNFSRYKNSGMTFLLSATLTLSGIKIQR